MHQKANLFVGLSTAIIYAWGHSTHISTVVLFAGLHASDTTLHASLKLLYWTGLALSRARRETGRTQAVQVKGEAGDEN